MKGTCLTCDQQKLVEQNLNIVSRVIYRYIIVNETLVGFEYDDLYQEGCIWLCKAAVSFQPDKGIPFSSYATKVVTNGLLTYCRLMCGKQKRVCSLSLYTDPELIQFVLEQIPDSAHREEDMISEIDAMQLLRRMKQQYTGTARLGIEAIELLVKGYSGKEIAAMYNVKPNLVGAWISRAKSKLKQNGTFMGYFQRSVEKAS